MKIIYVAPSPRAGQIDHLQPHRAQALIDSGFAQAVPYKDFRERLREEEAARQSALAPVYAEVKWAVAQGIISGKYYISGKCSAPNCTALNYDGAPTDNLTFTHSCGCACSHPEKVPAAIVEQYRKLKKSQPVTQLGRDEAVAAVLGAPQPSKPVDMTRILPANPTQEGVEREHLLMFGKNKGDGQHRDPSDYIFPVKEGK